MDDYIQQRSDMMVLKNFLNIDVPNNKKYKFTEEDLKNYAKYGIMFAKNLSCVQNLPPTPTPCPTYSTPSRA